jgi:NTE family protein
MASMKKPRVGLALGSGSARGWSHIGVIRTLEEAGVSPDIVCGTSIGAIVGAAYADGQLDRLEAWARTLTWQSVAGFMDLSLSGGLIQGAKLFGFLSSEFTDKDIGALAKPYGAVATELMTGREVWLREGSVMAAARASMALPGLFSPAKRDGRLLVDGGLVNPVPVSLCRAMGADFVIAVDLNWDLLGRHAVAETKEAEAASRLTSLLAKLPFVQRTAGGGPPEAEPAPDAVPAILDVMSISLNIMQVRITRSRLAGEPADLMVRPRLSNLALMDFHRADVAIDAGRRAAEAALPYLNDTLDGYGWVRKRQPVAEASV